MRYLMIVLLFVVAALIYRLGYDAGWDASERTLVKAWIKYYDVEKDGSYWDNKEKRDGENSD